MRKFIFSMLFVGVLQIILVCGIFCVCTTAQAEEEYVTFEVTIPDLDFFDGVGGKPVSIVIQSDENKNKIDENKKNKCGRGFNPKWSCPEGVEVHEEVIERYSYPPTSLVILQASTVITVGMKYYVKVVALDPDQRNWKIKEFTGKAKSNIEPLHVDSWELKVNMHQDWIKRGEAK
jgi:hypothetical protein